MNRSNKPIPHPPSFTPTYTLQHKYRFQASAVLMNVQITSRDFFDLLIVALTATTGVDLVTGFRIQNVEIWGPMAQALTPVTASIEYPGFQSSVGSPTKIKSDTSMGATEVAHVKYPPPPGSAQSFWQNQNTTNVFLQLNGPSGSIVDITMAVVLQDGEAPVAPTAAIAGATPGQVYIRALDSNGAALLVPVSFPTI